MTEILDIVDKQDNVVGQAERNEVHQKGLICRLVYVCFYTPEKQIILQRRSLTKKSNPGKLTMAVSGHVESGATYDETAIKETFEETGVKVDPSKLTLLGVQYKEYTEGSYLSNAMRALYVYEFNGKTSDLKVEEGEGTGFEIMTIDELKSQLAKRPSDFVPFLADSVDTGLLDKLISL